MLQVGITGGIGSGKTTVCRVFETLGVPVFYADDEARRLQNENENVKAAIKNLFGENIYSSEGLNRKAVAEKVFADASLLEKLNAIVHPATIHAFEEWKKNHANKKYFLKEAAILFETGLNKSLDKIIVVIAPEDLKVQRIMKRDSVLEEQVISRMKNQMSDIEKISLADFVIVNDEKQAVIPQVIKIHNLISNEAF